MSSILTVTAPATSRVLADVTKVALELDIPSSESTATLQRLVRAASAVIEGWCRRVFAVETVQEVIRGESGECINLRRYPVAGVTSITLDGTTLAAEEYELDAEAGQLWRLSGDCRIGWSCRKIVIVYTAGYAVIPDDVTQACIQLVTSYHLGQGRDLAVRGESSQDVGQISYLDPREGMEALLPQVAGMLRPHRSFG